MSIFFTCTYWDVTLFNACASCINYYMYMHMYYVHGHLYIYIILYTYVCVLYIYLIYCSKICIIYIGMCVWGCYASITIDYFTSSDPHPRHLFVIVSDISSGKIFIYGIIFWHSILAFFLPYVLAYVLACCFGILSDILFWHSIWHLFWHYFLAFYLVYLRRFFVVEARQGTLWSGARGWGPAGNTLIRNLRWMSGGEHSDPALAVEVRRGTLWSGACGGCPAGNTLIRSLRWMSGGEHCDLEPAVEVRWRKEEEGGGQADVKSNNPHLTGGEKKIIPCLSISRCMFLCSSGPSTAFSGSIRDIFSDRK